MRTNLPTGTITFLFTDIQGSTPLWERASEKMAEALQVHNQVLRGAIEANGGVVFKIVGDAFQAAFDTALKALKAAIEGQKALQSAQWNELGELKVRMGLHTGEAELDSGGNEYAVSHTKNRAARIMSAAHGEQILVSAETSELINHQLPPGVSLKDLGEHHLKGLLYPEHLYQVVVSGLQVDFPPLASESRPSHNLPLELTSFIGRQQEILYVQELLRRHRLVTLTGSGGVGKTRLSIEAVGGMLAEFPNGIWYVELAPISDPGLVAQTVAVTLGLREEPNRQIIDTLGQFLSSRNLLLVLDNCEHLLEACANLADSLLKKAPLFRILTSSREALGIAGEQAFRVPSMTVPEVSEMLSYETVDDFEAVQLFVSRAQAVLPSFQINVHNVQAVATVCQRLDGIPLALELAAARLNMLTTEQLARRLNNAFRLLTGGSRTALPRQQTLRATIDWSYQLLSDQEKILLRRLAVFAGSGALEGIEAICSRDGVDEGQVLDLLSGLVGKSIVSAERKQQEETRYRLYETVRQYAREKLFESGESESLRNQHLDYYVAFCEEAYPHIHGAGRLEWTRKLRQEYDNIREALEWAFQDSALAMQGLRIATAITIRFWVSRGFSEEGIRWLKTGLETAGIEITQPMKAKVFLGLSYLVTDEEQSNRIYQECITLCREIRPLADRELCLALVVHTFTQPGYQVILAEEGVQIARAMGAGGKWELGETLFWYGMNLSLHPDGKYDDLALAAAEESLLINQSGDRWNAGGYWTIGLINTLRGQHEQACKALELALEDISEAEDFNGILGSIFFLAWHHRFTGQYIKAQQYTYKFFEIVDAVTVQVGQLMFIYSYGMLLVSRLNDPISKWDPSAGIEAVKLLANAEFLKGKYGWGWYSRLKQYDLEALELLRRKLGEEAYSKAWKEGQALTLEQAVALAREVNVD